MNSDSYKKSFDEILVKNNLLRALIALSNNSQMTPKNAPVQKSAELIKLRITFSVRDNLQDEDSTKSIKKHCSYS